MQAIYQSLNKELIEYFKQEHTHDNSECNKEFIERFISNQEIRELLKEVDQRFIFNLESRTHPDLSERFYLISKDLSEAVGGSFFGYDVLINTNAIIFGTAMSMNRMLFRLNAEDRILAIELGGRIVEELGDDWILFDPWGSNLPTKKVVGDLQYWCNEALTYVNGLTGEKSGSKS